MPHATPSCLIATAAAIASALAAPALAQQFPNKPIRLIAPSSTGSGVDLVSRMLAVPLSAELGQQVVVDNRAGAGGYIGADLAAKATPNGYTIIMGTPSQVINAAVYKNLSRNLQKEFAPISLATSGQYVLLVNNSVPAKTPAQFIALAKAKPGQIAYGSAGKGNVTHLTGELFQHAAGVKLLHVPFKGSGPGFVGIMGGEIQAMVANIAAAIPHMRAGKVHAIASTGAKRAGVAPDLPTFARAASKTSKSRHGSACWRRRARRERPWRGCMRLRRKSWVPPRCASSWRDRASIRSAAAPANLRHTSIARRTSGSAR